MILEEKYVLNLMLNILLLEGEAGND
jgi:hypothetical protein